MSNVIDLERERNRRGAYFGVCPHCRCHDGYVNLGREHWFYCKRHRVMWWFGDNVFSSWMHETAEEQRASAERVAGFVVVEPLWPPEPPADPSWIRW
jgi:hypothetical protein